MFVWYFFEEFTNNVNSKQINGILFNDLSAWSLNKTKTENFGLQVCFMTRNKIIVLEPLIKLISKAFLGVKKWFIAWL